MFRFSPRLCRNERVRSVRYAQSCFGVCQNKRKNYAPATRLPLGYCLQPHQVGPRRPRFRQIRSVYRSRIGCGSAVCSRHTASPLLAAIVSSSSSSSSSTLAVTARPPLATAASSSVTSHRGRQRRFHASIACVFGQSVRPSARRRIRVRASARCRRPTTRVAAVPLPAAR